MTIKLTDNKNRYIEFKKVIIPIESTVATLKRNYAALDALINATFPLATLPMTKTHILNSVAGRK
jgi:hypothetical protein